MHAKDKDAAHSVLTTEHSAQLELAQAQLRAAEESAEREKERNSPGKGGDASSQRSLFQHSKQDKIDALKDAKAELKIGAEQLLQEQMAKHGLMMNAGANVRRTDEFGFQAADQTVDKQIMKIKRLDLSKLNTAI